MSEETAQSREPNTQTADRVGRMSKIDFYPFALIAFLLGLVGIVTGVWMWIDARNRTNKHVLQATADANEINRLRNRMTELMANNKVITALDIVTRHTNALPGSAIEADGQTRIASETAVLKYGPEYKGKIDRFELDFTAINALKAVGDSVMFRKTQADKLSFAEHSFAPILFPKCQSVDPTEAAGALVVSGHLLNECGLRHVEKEEQAAHLELVTRLRRYTKDMKYVDIDFGSLEPNFNYLVLEGTSFQNSNFMGGVSFVNSKFLPADFSGSIFKNADFRRIRSVPVETGVSRFSNAKFHSFYLFENNKFPENHFDGCVFLDCKITTSDFTGSDFSSSTNALRDDNDKVAKWGKLSFIDCDFTGANFSNSRYSGVKFNKCKLDMADFHNANLTYAKFDEGSAIAVDFGSLDANSSFSQMELQGCSFGQCQITPKTFNKVLLDWARIPAASTEFTDKLIDGSVKAKFANSNAMILLVSPIESANDDSNGESARYEYQGLLFLQDGKFVKGGADKAELLNRLSKLTDVELQRIRLRPEKVKDRKPASFVTELATNPHWLLQLPN